MKNPEIVDHQEISVKKARHMFKLAERDLNKLRGHDSGFLRQTLGRGIFRLGFSGIAQKLAPEEAAFLKHQEARMYFEEARLQDALRTAHDVTIPNPFPIGTFKPNPIREFNKDNELAAPVEQNLPFQVLNQTNQDETFRTYQPEIEDDNTQEPEIKHWKEYK